MGTEILLYVPNVIGYIRVVLLVISWCVYYSHPLWFLFFYVSSVILDAVDGFAARKLNQISAFGAWLDVVIDIMGRGMLWCRLYHFGYLVACLEWLTFVCTHSLGAKWKQAFVGEPGYVKKVMANNFRTPLGIYVMAGIHALPIWLYAHYSQVLTEMLHIPVILQHICTQVLAVGRAIAFSVEVWCIWTHILYLLSDEANKTVADSEKNGRSEVRQTNGNGS